MEVRRAIAAEAPAICTVVRRSILELCVADHRNDATVLARWLANKTPENVVRWIENPADAFLVAVEDGTVVGAGCIARGEVITLNYVSPDARLRGVSRAMVHAMETVSRTLGHRACKLDSTRTALRFYAAQGYQPNGEPREKFGLPAYPMIKPL